MMGDNLSMAVYDGIRLTEEKKLKKIKGKS